MAEPTPSEPPPSYSQSISQAATTVQASSSTSAPDPTHLQVPSTTPHKTRNGIPPDIRRSMEDETRPLPPNWVRQFDNKVNHHFYVDTSATPPRSIWHHPYDDETFLSTLSPEDRSKIQSLSAVPPRDDIVAESSADEDHDQLPPRPEDPPTGLSKLGRKMKDKLTNSTHEERQQRRAQREAEEREAYRQHQHIRKLMVKAAETGQPQLIGKDRDGKDVYIEPPAYGNFGGGYGAGYGGPYGGGFAGGPMGYGGPPNGGAYGNGYGYSPYATGVYANPDARFIRPQDPYGRPYGSGYGGGLGLPLLGGLAGGLLLGDLLF